MIRNHMVPNHVITDRVTGGGFIAYLPNNESKTFGHGITRYEAIADLLAKIKPKLEVIEGGKT